MQCVAELDIEVFYSGEELCGFISQGNYFDLDIEMQMPNGVEACQKLRYEMDNQTTPIVYVFCRESYYRELFEARPLNFINKPVTPSEIIKEIEKALSLTGKLQGVYTYKEDMTLTKFHIKAEPDTGRPLAMVWQSTTPISNGTYPGHMTTGCGYSKGTNPADNEIGINDSLEGYILWVSMGGDGRYTQKMRNLEYWYGNTGTVERVPEK